MKPKEKAKELVFKFGKVDHINDRCLPFLISQQCALIAVDEILLNFGFGANKFYSDYQSIQFYTEVKQEIEKL